MGKVNLEAGKSKFRSQGMCRPDEKEKKKANDKGKSRSQVVNRNDKLDGCEK